MGTVYIVPIISELATVPDAQYVDINQLTQEQLSVFNAVTTSGLHYARHANNNTTVDYYIATKSGNFYIAFFYDYSNPSLPTFGYYRLNPNTTNRYICISGNNATIAAIYGATSVSNVPVKLTQPNDSYTSVTLLVDYYETEEAALEAISQYVTYPITYSYTNSTVSGPSEAAVGDSVAVSAVPDVDYGITDQSSQIAVTCNDEPVAFSWDATNQRITFTMPDPS